MKRFYAAAAMAALIFSSCSTDEFDTLTNAPDSALLGFSSVMTARLQTRADDGLKQNFKFNLSASGSYVALLGQEVTWDGTKFTAPAITIFKEQTHTLTAWAPATTAPKAETTDTFTLTPGKAAVDFLYATPITNVTTANCDKLALAMKHAMAKLTFLITFPSEYKGAKEVSILTVNGTPAASEFNISTPAWGRISADAPLAIVTSAVAATSDLSAFVIPKTDAMLTVDCTVDGVEYTGVAISGITAVDAATNYTITLEVTGTGLDFGGVTEGGWATGAAGSGTL